VSAAAQQLSVRVLVRQSIIGLTTIVLLAVTAPRILLFDAPLRDETLRAITTVGAVAVLLTGGITALRLRSLRFLLRSLALGSSAVEPEELAALGALPMSLAVRFFVTTSLASLLLFLPQVRPPRLDFDRTTSLFIFGVTLSGAMAIVNYVLLRDATLRVIELGPRDPAAALLAAWEKDGTYKTRAVRAALLVAIIPVLLVGSAAVLVSHAHHRAFVEESRRRTATIVARCTLEPGIGPNADAARESARNAIASLGFRARIERGRAHLPGAESDLGVTVPLEDGRASIRFAAESEPIPWTGGGAIAAIGALVAGICAAVLGSAISRDLTLASRGIRLLGTDAVLGGGAHFPQRGRFDVVRDLEAAIDALAKRFAVFAKAQERALEAGEAQRRTRGLLFASVSHDLKNPLNAILGFADLLDTEELTMAQRENLSFVISRGRELLTLIETILDAARVEAGQLTLQPKAMTANELVESSLTRARDLAGDAAKAGALVDIVAPDARVLGDTLHLTRAVAVIIALALRTSASDKSGRSVSITVKAEEPPGSLCITIAHGSSALSENEIEELFARRFTARHRGLTLGLGLARTVIELHGGTVTVESSDDGIPRVACRLPIYRETDLSAGSSPSTFDDG